MPTYHKSRILKTKLVPADFRRNFDEAFYELEQELRRDLHAVSVGNTNHNVGDTSEFVAMGTRTAGKTVLLPLRPFADQQVTVRDKSGQASTYNITIDGNGKAIDVAPLFIIASDSASVSFIYNGTSWDIMSLC